MNKKQYLSYIQNMFNIYNKLKTKKDYNFTEDEFGYYFSRGLDSEELASWAYKFMKENEETEANYFTVIVQTLVAGYDEHQKTITQS